MKLYWRKNFLFLSIYGFCLKIYLVLDLDIFENILSSWPESIYLHLVPWYRVFWQLYKQHSPHWARWLFQNISEDWWNKHSLQAVTITCLFFAYKIHQFLVAVVEVRIDVGELRTRNKSHLTTSPLSKQETLIYIWYYFL